MINVAIVVVGSTQCDRVLVDRIMSCEWSETLKRCQDIQTFVVIHGDAPGHCFEHMAGHWADTHRLNIIRSLPVPGGVATVAHCLRACGYVVRCHSIGGGVLAVEVLEDMGFEVEQHTQGEP